MPDTELLWVAPGHVLARFRTVVVQLRSAELTLEILGAIETTVHLARAQMPKGAPTGALLVIQAGAPRAVGQAAIRQREFLRSLGDDERLHFALVLEGEGVHLFTQRVLSRALPGKKRRQLCDSVPDAARALTAVLGIPERERELASFVEEMRGKL